METKEGKDLMGKEEKRNKKSKISGKKKDAKKFPNKN